MQRIALLLVACLSLSLCGCERATSASPTALPSASVQVVRAEFGLFNIAENGKAAFVPSKTVPLSVNQPYGWVVTLNTAQPKVKWREEFILPSAAAIWGKQPEGTHTVSPDRTISVTEREVEPVRGVIFNSWSVAEGDPKGRHLIRLTIENQSPIEFEFNVE